MTKLEAVLSMPSGYSQAELQFIWEGSAYPILEIMSLVRVSRGEARELWNARNNNEKEFEDYMAVHGKTPAEWDEIDFVSGLEHGRKPGDVT